MDSAISDDNEIKIGTRLNANQFNRILKSEYIKNYPIDIVEDNIILNVKKFKKMQIYTIKYEDKLIGFRWNSKNHLELFSVGLKSKTAGKRSKMDLVQAHDKNSFSRGGRKPVHSPLSKIRKRKFLKAKVKIAQTA